MLAQALRSIRKPRDAVRDPVSGRNSLRARPWFLPLCVALAAALSLPWMLRPWYDPINDGSIYVSLARSLARGGGYAYLGEPFRIRPPGFAAMLAPLIAWRGFDPALWNVFVSVWGIAAVALFCAWARERVGALVAAALAALVWFNPLFRDLCNEPLSDVPGAALIFLGLLLERRARAKPSTARDAVLGAVIGVSSLIRSQNILLLPALVCARALEHRRAGAPGRWLDFARRRLLPAVAACVLVMMPWMVRNASLPEPGRADQTMLHSYWTAMWHVDPGDPSSPRIPLGQLVARGESCGLQLLSVFGSSMRTEEGARSVLALGAALLALALFSAVRRGGTADFLMLGNLALLAFYFDFRDRLALPLWMIVLVLACETLLALGTRIARRPRAQVAVAALVIAATVLAAPLVRPTAEIARKDAEWRDAAAAFGNVLPANWRLASLTGWHYEAYLDRPVYNLGFAFKRAHGMAGIERVIARREIDAVLVAHFDRSSLAFLPQLQARYPYVEVPGGGYVFHVGGR